MKLANNRRGLPSRRTILIVLAIVLPLLAAAISARITVIHRTPYALSMLAVVVIAGLSDPVTTLIAVFFSFLGRMIFFAMVGDPVPINRFELIRIAAVLAVGMTISFMTRRRRRAAAQLELAHAELQERTDALAESLHSSKCASWTMQIGDHRGPVWFSGSYPIFGRPFEELSRLDFFLSGVSSEDRDKMVQLFAHMKTSSDPVRCEYRAPGPDGELHWFEMRANRVPGAAPLWRGLTMDITERKLIEFALLRSEKLAAVTRLASTVAHEINNPLEAVTNLLFLAQSDTTLRPDTQVYLATAEKELARLGDITRLNIGSLRNSSIRRSIEVSAVADEVLSGFRHRLESKGARIERNFQPGLSIEIAPHELRQILTNLVSNAADAMDGAQSRIAVLIQQSENDTVQVLVEDNGSGIDSATLPRVFEPFFTTKHDIGTGIGLWVTRELVESNGGRITAESGALPNGVKTRFTIDFPAAG